MMILTVIQKHNHPSLLWLSEIFQISFGDSDIRFKLFERASNCYLSDFETLNTPTRLWKSAKQLFPVPL